MRLLTALLALALPLAPNGAAQVLPAGKFAARDGRPGPGKFWQLSDDQGAALAASLNAIAAQTPISIDYEHQTLLAPTNGQPAPAAGWMTSFEWRAGEGLFAQVRWTPRAQAYIEGDEYRYISPVILYDSAGNVTGLHNAALVSTPALLGMDAVEAALSAAAQFSTPRQPRKKDPPMDLAVLIAMLGLAASSTAAEVTAALQALIARPAVPAALATALGLQAGADETTAVAALAAMRTRIDPNSLAVVADLQRQVAALSAQTNDSRQPSPIPYVL